MALIIPQTWLSVKFKNDMLKLAVMKSTVENQPKATIKLTVVVPADRVKETHDHVLQEFAENMTIEGFRKGKAPLDIVKKNVKEADLNGEIVNHLIREYYVAAIKEHHLTPIGNPKVTIKKFEPDADFEFEAITPLKPEVKLGDYKGELKKLHLKKNLENKGEELPLSVDEVITAISDVTDTEFSDMLIEEEVTRMLSRLLEQAETLGLGIDQYLSAQNKTAESLRKEYEESASKNLKAEFALGKAIELENVKVEEAEVTEAINNVPDEKLKTRLQSGADKWYIEGILAKNKLIKQLIEGVSE